MPEVLDLGPYTLKRHNETTGSLSKKISVEQIKTSSMIRITVTDYQGIEESSIKYIKFGDSATKPIASFKGISLKTYLYNFFGI